MFIGHYAVGLGLWNSVTGTFVTEGILFSAGVWFYLSFTHARDRMALCGFPAFVLVVLLMYLGAALGQPPPSVEALAWVSIGGCLVPLWAAWLDRHRAVRCAGGGAWAI